MQRKLNDTDRCQWIDNDEGLYLWWQQARYSACGRTAMTKRQFIRQHRAEIDVVIVNILNGHKPAHYLTYEM